MRLIPLIFIAILLFGCKKNDPPQVPDATSLIFPERSSECTTGIELNSTTSEVEFRWQTAQNTDTYELRVTDVMANTSQRIEVAAQSARLPLHKGALYSWQVATKNDDVEEVVLSEEWQFYNAGAQTTYAPFPASINAPISGTSVNRNTNNQITLNWTGADIDNDIMEYEVYLSTENPPVDLLQTLSVSTSRLNVDVTPNTVHYWKVITRDREGNTSDSGIFDFRSL